MKFKQVVTLPTLTLCLLLTACGGGSSSNQNSVAVTEPETTETEATAPTQGQIFGPNSTGSISEPAFVYFDLDNQEIVELTAEQAKSNSDWDVAFKRSGIFLNQHADNSVMAYATGNNNDFFDADDNTIADSFINASAESELDNYLAVTTTDIPSDDTMFVGDVTSNIIDGFYSYNTTTHVVSAAESNYFIVNSDDAFTKFSITDIATVGRVIGQITLQTAYQGPGDAEFTVRQALILDASLTCSGAVTHLYVDFNSNQEVTMGDDWDISIPCSEDKTGADFTINIADDAQAIQDFDNNYTAVDPTAVAYYGFQENIYSVKAFDNTPWYQYGVNGGHLLWSQFDIYLIKTATTTHKLQMTSYYNDEGTSGNISFRADELNDLAGVAGE